MEFSRQKYWSGLPLSSPGDLPDLGTEPGSLALQADSLSSEPPRVYTPPNPVPSSWIALKSPVLFVPTAMTLCDLH